MKNIFKYLMIICIGGLLHSCYYDAYIEEEATDPGDGGGEVPTVVSFQTDIQPIFAKCTGCHGGNLNPDLREGNSYASLVPTYVKANDSGNSELFIKLAEGHQGVSNANLELIKAWIDQGAENN